MHRSGFYTVSKSTKPTLVVVVLVMVSLMIVVIVMPTVIVLVVVVPVKGVKPVVVTVVVVAVVMVTTAVGLVEVERVPGRAGINSGSGHTTYAQQAKCYCNHRFHGLWFHFEFSFYGMVVLSATGVASLPFVHPY